MKTKTSKHKKLIIKKGDLFCVLSGNNAYRYFQYILDDPCQLNAPVIRIFNYKGQVYENDFSSILNSGIDFHTHVVIKWGVDQGYWKKIGHSKLEFQMNKPIFRDVFGIDDEIVNGKTNRWHIWQAGLNFSNRKSVGFLTEESEKIELGLFFHLLKYSKDYNQTNLNLNIINEKTKSCGNSVSFAKQLLRVSGAQLQAK